MCALYTPCLLHCFHVKSYEKSNNFSVNNANNWTKQMKKWNTQKWRKEREKTVWFIIIIYGLVLHLSALQVRMCMAWWKQSLFEPARSLSIAFSLFIRQIVRVVIFIKKIKLFHSKRSTILCLAKIQNVEFKQKNEPNLMLMENALGSHSICNWNFTLHRTIVCHRFTYIAFLLHHIPHIWFFRFFTANE